MWSYRVVGISLGGANDFTLIDDESPVHVASMNRRVVFLEIDAEIFLDANRVPGVV